MSSQGPFTGSVQPASLTPQPSVFVNGGSVNGASIPSNFPSYHNSFTVPGARVGAPYGPSGSATSRPGLAAQPIRSSPAPTVSNHALAPGVPLIAAQRSTAVAGLQHQLLRGPAINVVVGPKDTLLFSNHGTASWSLPKALIHHCSPFLEAASTRDFRERQENCIRLPEDNPKTFDLFVEWMYHGTYTLVPHSDVDTEHLASLDAEAWVLGDKLLSTEFKNYAMDRLYAQYATNPEPKAIKSIDIQHACTHSAADSALRRLFIDLAATYFHDSERVVGATKEWDQVLLQHEDAREFLLSKLRIPTNQRQFVKDKDAYMEKALVKPSTHVRSTNENVLTPAKRDAVGARVKKEALGA
ncbi:Nn.00g089400.m01.CDS01 [Neocucurbitaria sp. VM-36]